MNANMPEIEFELERRSKLIMELQVQLDLAREREAKLIADTRLEESKFWWNVHRSLSHEGVSNCSMCEHHRANRAAAQGGASRDDS